MDAELSEEEIDRRRARIRALAAEVGVELPTYAYGDPAPIGRECPHCHFDSLVSERSTALFSTGVEPAGGLIYCGRESCPSNRVGGQL